MRPRGQGDTIGDGEARPPSIIAENQGLILLCKDDIVRLNRLVLEAEYQDSPSDTSPIIIDAGRLDSIVEGQNQTIFGFDPHPSIYDKAAYLLCNFSFHHCFYAGNKRTAWESCRVILRANHIGIYYNCAETVKICFGIAELRQVLPADEDIDEALDLKIAETIQWIKERSFPIPE